jgi:steroid delta-isomerase-like uncharacterized protein
VLIVRGPEALDVDSESMVTVKTLYEAYQSRDWDAFKRCIADRCVWIDSRGDQHLGPEEVATYFQGWLASCSDERLDVEDFLDAGDAVVVTGVMRGTNDGPLGPLPPSGRAFELPYCEVFHLEGPKVTRYRVYADITTLMVQLGHI